MLAHERVVNFCNLGLDLAVTTVKATVEATVKATIKRQLRAVELAKHPHPYTTEAVVTSKHICLFERRSNICRLECCGRKILQMQLAVSAASDACAVGEAAGAAAWRHCGGRGASV